MIPAIDGPRPDLGHEVSWVLRDALSGEALPAKSPLSSRRGDLAELPGEGTAALRAGGRVPAR